MTAAEGAGLPPEFTAPGDWTPEQVAEFAAGWERLTSDPKFGHQVRFLPPGAAVGLVTHIAGPEVQVGSHFRQRCAWCGVTLADAITHGPPMWAQGDLVRNDGDAWFVTGHEEGADLPAGSCAVAELDAITGM